MRRYLLVLDMDLLALDEELDLEPINHLVARREQERGETRAHHYDEVILATGRQGVSWLARSLRPDPVHQLRRRWRQRLVIFAPGQRTKPQQQ